MKYLVFGGSGFVGSQLVKDLLRFGHRVWVYDNFFTGRKLLLPQTNKRLAVISENILDSPKVNTVIFDVRPEYIINLAAIHYIPYCNDHPIETLRVNIEGTQSILDACRNSGEHLKKFIFASSAAVYPISNTANLETDPISSSDIYGITKICGEQLVELFCRETGIPSVSLRLFNIYGPNDTNPHVFPEILAQMKRRESLMLGNIESKRDFIFIKDVSEALIKMAEIKDSSYRVFNLGTGKEYSVRDIINLIFSILGESIEIKVDPKKMRTVDRMHLLADIRAITRYIDWKPKYDIKSGVRALLRGMAML